MNFDGYTLINNVYVNKNSIIKNEFEEKYIELRKKENRLYSDDELISLPHISKDHPHYEEWALRKQSAERLFHYLSKKRTGLKILEIGCGNGWLSNFLAGIIDSYVVGLDINLTELKQAANVFKKENLAFVYDVGSKKLLPGSDFNTIVFAASAQYFSSIQQTIKEMFTMLNKDGEIHILDTNFYKLNEVADAKKRTENYYTSLGFPGLSEYYHHHVLNELDIFCVDTLYDPSSLKNIFNRHKNPFPWFRIK